MPKRSHPRYQEWTYLRRARLRAGMTPEQLAEATTMHWTSIYQLEQGRWKPSGKTILVLARVLNVDAADLDRTKPKPPPRGSTSTRTGAA